MNILILGGTGFIGKNLSLRLLKEGYNLYILTRNPEKIFSKDINFLLWDGEKIEGDFPPLDAIINFAGESIFSIFYTGYKKKKIIESRVNSGKAIVDFVRKAKVKPEVLIQASAIGYYGNSNEEKDEDSPPGKSFLSKVCVEWEKSVENIEEYGVRKCIIRIGIVLGEGGFILKLSPFLKLPFLFLPYHTENFLSFIHIEDLLNAIVFLLKNKNSKGIYNLVAPEYLKVSEFYKTLSKILNKRLVRFPSFIFEIIMRDMAQEIIFFNNRIVPKRLLQENFKFLYPDAEKALISIFNKY